MNISFEKIDATKGKIVMQIEEADYSDKVANKLKTYRKKANIPGFRPGNAPMGMIKKQFEIPVKIEEINQLINTKLIEYIREQKISMLGEPMENAETNLGIEDSAPYKVVFDIALEPEFDIELSEKDQLDYYQINVDDKLIDQQVDMYASKSGEYVKVDEFQENDMLKGDIRQLDKDGNTLENGITVEGAVMMPAYMKNDEQKAKFLNAKAGDIITFDPRAAFPENDVEVSSLLKIKKEEVKDLQSEFSFQIIEITRYKKAEVDQKLFDTVFGKDQIKTEEEFRNKIKEAIEHDMQLNSMFKFQMDLKQYCLDQVGKLEYADDILKELLKKKNKDNNVNVDESYENSMKELTWHLIKVKLAEQLKVKIEDKDIKEEAKMMARQLFANYGMPNVPEEYVDNYAQELLSKPENLDQYRDRAIEKEIAMAIKGKVKLNEKQTTFEEFQELVK